MNTNLHYPNEEINFADARTDEFPELRAVIAATDKEKLQKRARAKYLGSAIVAGLVEHAQRTADHPLLASYRRSAYCAEEIQVRDGIATTKYCKNRWCLVCNRIYTAAAINKHREAIKQNITAPYFLTLTVPNCEGKDLKTTIKHMFKCFTAIRKKWQKRCEREKDPTRQDAMRLRAVLRLECTYNAVRGDFHPHFHLIVHNAGDQLAGEFIREEWLKRNLFTVNEAQQLQPIRARRETSQPSDANATSWQYEAALLEVFKYTTKMLSEVEKEANGQKVKKSGHIYISALDQMYQAFAGMRLLRTYGLGMDDNETDEQIITEAEQQDIADLSAEVSGGVDQGDEETSPIRLYKWFPHENDWCSFQEVEAWDDSINDYRAIIEITGRLTDFRPTRRELIFKKLIVL